ncbi:MAG: amidase family protein, partial [Rhodobacteraceae bacterium]|nr:amidase family protein [Paracoccaceae bacterium]
ALRDMRGLRIGWLGDWGGAYPCEPGILAQCEAALRECEMLGAVVEPLAPPYPAEQLWEAWVTLRAMLNAGTFRAFYEDPAKRALLKPETLWEIARGQGLSAAAVHAASTIRSRWYAHAARLFRSFDLLAMPAAQVWPFPADWRWPQSINGRAMDSYHRWMEVVVPLSLIGLPSLSVPAGFGAAGLPTGVQLIGPAGADADVLAAGAAYHRATGWPQRRPPVL